MTKEEMQEILAELGEVRQLAIDAFDLREEMDHLNPEFRESDRKREVEIKSQLLEIMPDLTGAILLALDI